MSTDFRDMLSKFGDPVMVARGLGMTLGIVVGAGVRNIRRCVFITAPHDQFTPGPNRVGAIASAGGTVGG